MKMKNEDFSTPIIRDDITIKEEFETWWDRIKPDEYNSIQVWEMKKSYYSGAATMGFIMNQLATEKDRANAVIIVERLFEEIKDFFDKQIDDMTNN